MTHPASNVDVAQPSPKKVPHDALGSALEKDGCSDFRTRFYNKFKEEVAEHDEDLQKMHDEDLNSTLIFSGLFSAVTAAFILDIQSELKPDYQQLNNELLELLLNVTAGNIPPGQEVSPPRWPGPDPAVRQAQAVLYAALCATLLAAFLATLGKQWLRRYRQTDTHGSPVDRCRDRERKLNGVYKWRFHIVMHLAPLTIQGSLALLGSALSLYLWKVDRLVSSVVIASTSVGFVLYITFVAASLVSFDCPFQTPPSLLIYHVNHKVRLWLQRWRWQRQNNKRVPDNLEDALFGPTLPQVMAPLCSLNLHVDQSRLSSLWKAGYNLDAHCITRMLVLSSDEDTVRITLEFVQDIIWHAEIKRAPLKEIYRTLISCFDSARSQTPTLNPRYRDLAYLSAKAFAYIHVQQRCIPQPAGAGWCPEEPHKPLGLRVSTDDPYLSSALLMVDKALGYNLEVQVLDNYQPLSPAHHRWMSHLFVYYAQRNLLSNDVSAFVRCSLDLEESPDKAVITDCLYIIGTLLGISPGDAALTRRDKSHGMNALVDRIFSKLSKYFSRDPPQTNTDVLERSLRALQLITRLRTTTVATRSYELFETIMQSTVEKSKKMEAARLALYPSYRQKTLLPVKDPRHIYNFLQYCNNLRTRGSGHATSVAPATNPGPNNHSMARFQTRPIGNASGLSTGLRGLPDKEELDWWNGLWSGALGSSVNPSAP